MKYAILDKQTRYNEKLNANEKLLFAELMLYEKDEAVSLENYDFLFCLLGCSAQPLGLRRALTGLKNQGLIESFTLAKNKLELSLKPQKSKMAPLETNKKQKSAEKSKRINYDELFKSKNVGCSYDVFVEFLRYKSARQSGKKLTDRTITMLINTINSVNDNKVADKMLLEAIEKGWAKPYPPKTTKNAVKDDSDEILRKNIDDFLNGRLRDEPLRQKLEKAAYFCGYDPHALFCELKM